jgi:hypothetical protein
MEAVETVDGIDSGQPEEAIRPFGHGQDSDARVGMNTHPVPRTLERNRSAQREDDRMRAGPESRGHRIQPAKSGPREIRCDNFFRKFPSLSRICTVDATEGAGNA